MMKLLTAISLLFLLVGCGGDLQQMRMKDNVDIQKSEWRYPGYNIVANVEMEHRNSKGELLETREYRNIVAIKTIFSSTLPMKDIVVARFI